jgi:hypothetical protein
MGQMNWNQVLPVLNPKVRGMCCLPYPGHKHGCPNHGQRDTCPPAAPLFPEAFDMTRPVWAVWNKFPFGEHVQRMREAHPKWSERQLACCLYWQGTARKQLREVIARFQSEHADLQVTTCPEAMGVNVTETMLQLGIELWPIEQWTYQVALAGTARERT